MAQRCDGTNEPNRLEPARVDNCAVVRPLERPKHRLERARIEALGGPPGHKGTEVLVGSMARAAARRWRTARPSLDYRVEWSRERAVAAVVAVAAVARPAAMAANQLTFD
ncbi:MAG: hypothetical protein LC808_00620 [Actinobacteria bacterium]|nr:hypothetical protein [Actinomycetota bacterium]